MATVTKRAACCNQATPARRTGQPAVGSRSSYSIARKKRRAKYLRRQITCLLLAAAALTALIYVVVGALTPDKPGTATVVTPRPVIETQTPIQTPSQTPAAEPTPAPRFELSAAERDVVERVVMAEAGGESFEGQMLVAQCILNAAEKRGVDPSEAVVLYSYTKSRPDPTQRVKDAVAAVFDRGETVVDEPILYFYNPALVTSDFHESQIFVIEEGGHRFFAERSIR